MASTTKHLRSSTASKRPTASGLAEGQLAINTASGTPGLFLKDSAGAVVKVGPVHVGASAPNAVPAGSAGNSTGELWVNNSATIHGLNYYTGSAFVNLTPSGTTTVAGLVELATDAETQTGTDTVRAVTPSGLQSKVSDSTSITSSTTIASSTAVKAAYDLANAALPKAGGVVTGALEIGTAGSLVFEGSSDNSFETTLAVVNPTADRTITLPNTTGTVITTGDSGTVTSAMIADLNIVNADINASAAIALSKLATGALPSGITVASANIVDGTIVNDDISASAAIVDTKLDTISTAGKVSGSAITSGTIATSGELQITNTAPGIRLTESDGTAGYSQVMLRKSSDIFTIETRDSAGTFVSSDYRILSDASGATEHEWRIAGTEKASLDSTGLTVVDDLTISDKIIHAGDTNTAIRFPAANTVSVETAGAERVRINNIGLQVVDNLYVSDNIIHLGDTNTAIRFPASDTVSIETGGAERLRVNSGGDILVGQTSTAQPGLDNTTVGMGYDASLPRLSGSRENGVFLLVNRNSDGAVMEIRRSGSIRGTISVTTSSTSYNTSSDYRLKENVVPLDGAIARLNQLPVHRFNFIADPDTVVDGFIAHEAAAVVPECVTGEKDEVDENGNPVYQGIDQSKVVPLLTAALQEAIAKIDALEARISALEA